MENNDEIMEQSSETTAVGDNTAYIEQIKNLKQNSVSKDKYDALKRDNEKLVEALANGQTVEANEEDKLNSRDYYYGLYKKNNFANDLEYWDNFLKLREATIKEEGLDPCVTGSFGLTPEGNKLDPEYGEPETVAQQMETIKTFIEQSEGNPRVFDTLMQSALQIQRK